MRSEPAQRRVPDTFTKRNHYKPCFWTALWNPVYFHIQAFREGGSAPGRAREQVVHTLNLRSDAFYPTTVENVHYEKNLGVAPMTSESMKAFCRRWFPSQAEGFGE